MDRDNIIRMATEAGLRSAVLLHIYGGKEAALTDSELDELRGLKHFAALVAKHEREACAKVAEEPYEFTSEESHRIAAAIRARGNT